MDEGKSKSPATMLQHILSFLSLKLKKAIKTISFNAMDEVGISSLPAPILQHILSLLSQKEAVRTCILSKSWRHLGSTRPNFILKESYFGEDNKEKFMSVLDKSLQVYFDQKLSIEDFGVSKSMVDPELVSLLGKWIPRVIHDMGVKKFHLSFGSEYPEYHDRPAEELPYFGLPAVVFESESLQELCLRRCYLSQINFIGNNQLKILNLCNVYVEEESFAKIMSSCPLIERLYLRFLHNHFNLRRFEIYLPSTAEYIRIKRCPNWFLHHYYFPSMTCLHLAYVPISNEWFNSFSRNFPCLEELRLFNCNGFYEFQLSSRSIKNLDITMDKYTNKATIDAPSIKKFYFRANTSQSISFTTTSSDWDSKLRLTLGLDASLWFLKISEFVAELSQSRISLMLSDSDSWRQHNEHLSDIWGCCGSYTPVATKRLKLLLDGHYYDSFLSDLMNGLFRIFRPRELRLVWDAEDQCDRKRNEFLCRTLQMGRSEEDGGMSFWLQDLEEVSLEVKNGHCEEWHPVQGTINWSEYLAALLPSKCSFYELRYRLKWRD